MNTTEKIKKIVLIAIGFGLSTYLILNGAAILSKEDNNQTQNIK